MADQPREPSMSAGNSVTGTPPSGSSRRTDASGASSVEQVRSAVQPASTTSWSPYHRAPARPASALTRSVTSQHSDFSLSGLEFFDVDVSFGASASRSVSERVSSPYRASTSRLDDVTTADDMGTYYAGLPSHPTLIASSYRDVDNNISRIDSGYPAMKYLTVPPASHPLRLIWTTAVAPAIRVILESRFRGEYCIDVVMIGFDNESEAAARMLVWIGVDPKSMGSADGQQLANDCKLLLEEHGVDDVGCEIRGTHTEASAMLYESKQRGVPRGCGTFASPFTNTLGIPISSAAAPDMQGTTGICMVDESQPGTFFMLTAQHNVSPLRDQFLDPPGAGSSISILTDTSYRKKNADLASAIGVSKAVVDQSDEDSSDPEYAAEKSKLEFLKTLQHQVQSEWHLPADRVIGSVYAFPSHHYGTCDEVPYTRDWAVIKLRNEIANWSQHNRMDLGDNEDLKTAVEYPEVDPALVARSKVVSVSGFADRNRLDESLAVLKNGATTGMTLGMTSAFESYRRNYTGEKAIVSRELPVFAAQVKKIPSACFSAPGDSGSLVITRDGAAVGIITGGSGKHTPRDITYLTPIFWIERDMRRAGMQMRIA